MIDDAIEVFADWTAGKPAHRIGILRARAARTAEVFDFTFDDDALTDPTLAKQSLDPDLGMFRGAQFPKNGRSTFGAFKDCSPDRWGEMLTRRRFDRNKRAGIVAANARLSQSD